MSTMKVTNLRNESSSVNNIVLNSDGSVGGELGTALASKLDYATPANSQSGTTYTFVLADGTRMTTATNAAAKTFTIPPQSSVAWGTSSIIRVVNYGLGALTINGGSGVTVTNAAKTLAQYESASLIRTGSDAWTLVPFGGGSSDADFSNTTSGTLIEDGINYKFVQFTSSGTLTVTRSGAAKLLIVGGGASGGTGEFGVGANSNGAGGGAGGVVESDVFLQVGNYTVTVGAGGASRSGTNQQGAAGSASSLTFTYTGGSGSQSVSAGSPNSGLTGGTSGMGFVGASGGDFSGGGGGGAGGNAPPKPGGNNKGNGGPGAQTAYTNLGVSGRFGGGGQGAGAGGAVLRVDGGGQSDGGVGGDGIANSGGGGAGRYADGGRSGSGGSGTVIVRVRV